MPIPTWDNNTLPVITKVYKNKKEKTRRYLGNKAITGDTYATLSLFAENATKAKALFDFWKDDLSYGTNAFYIPLPVFGSSFVPEVANVLCKIINDFEQDMNDSEAREQTLEIKLYNASEDWFIVDDEANQIIDDSGNTIITSSELEF